MYKLLFSLVVLCGLILAFKSTNVDFKKDAEKGIQFHKGSWNDALKKAKTENKLIFLDVYATWCGPCKRLKSQTFSNAEVGLYFNERFVNVALDGEKDDGRQLVKTYGIRSYPSLLFIDGNGKIIKSTMGFHTSDDLITFAKTVLKK